MDKSISILGAGWLGLPLAIHLQNEGYSVKAATRSSEKALQIESNNIPAYTIDITNPNENIKKFLLSDILIINITSKDIKGFELLVKNIEDSSVANVLFISSTSVYQNKGIVNEESDLDENNPLVQIEKLFIKNNHFKTTILRFAGLFGGSRKPGNFFRNSKVVSDPENFVNLIHLDDCIGIIETIIKKNIWGEIFNASMETHPTKRTFYTLAAEAIGNTPPAFSDSPLTEYKIIENKKVVEKLGYNFIYKDLMNLPFDKI